MSLLYGPDPSNILEFIFTIKSIGMTKGPDGWYTCTFDKLGNTAMKDGAKMYFAVMLTPAKRCSSWSLTNFYLTKSVAYQIGTGCQDEEVYKIIEFEKTYDHYTAMPYFKRQCTGYSHQRSRCRYCRC